MSRAMIFLVSIAACSSPPSPKPPTTTAAVEKEPLPAPEPVAAPAPEPVAPKVPAPVHDRLRDGDGPIAGLPGFSLKRTPSTSHAAAPRSRPRAEGREAELAELLRSARDFVLDEPDTKAWFALRFESGELGIFDAFPNRKGRLKHLVGKVPRELVKNTRLLGGMPRMAMLDIQAESFATQEPQFVS